MELNKLERAGKLLAEIKKLDVDIIEIEKVAMMAANGEAETFFELKVVDIKKQIEDSEKLQLDEDGSLLKPSYTYTSLFEKYAMPFSWMETKPQSTEKKNELVLNNALSERATMLILGVLLEEKQSKRLRYINKLKNLGVAI